MHFSVLTTLATILAVATAALGVPIAEPMAETRQSPDNPLELSKRQAGSPDDGPGASYKV